MNRLKDLRKKSGLSQKEISEMLGIKTRTYMSYENNEREPNSELLKIFADFFDVSIDYLIKRTDYSYKKNNENNEINNIISKYNILNNLGKEKAEEYITDLSEQEKYTK